MQGLQDVIINSIITFNYPHYFLGYLLGKDSNCFTFNPLHTNPYRKSLTLRKIKTDKVDSKIIAKILLSEVDFKPYSKALYHNKQLKSLFRYRFPKVRERGNLKQKLARLVNILSPELEKLVPSLHMSSVYARLEEFPAASMIANAHLTKLTKLLSSSSKGHYKKDKALQIRNVATTSVGCVMPAKSLELQHAIQLIRILSKKIDKIEAKIQNIMAKINFPITSIPGLGFRMAAMILSEISNFFKFDSPNKILAIAGISPSTYQSGKLDNTYAHMEKRGSRYLRHALYSATIYVCNCDKTFSIYLQKNAIPIKKIFLRLSSFSFSINHPLFLYCAFPTRYLIVSTA